MKYLEHAQLSESGSGLREYIEVSDSPSQSQFIDHISNSRDLDLPITLRKRSRKCTQHPLSHFVSFDQMSPSHKIFLSHLVSIRIP